jgi:hypothetical protein
MAKGQVRKKKIWMRQRDKRCNGMPNHGSVAAVAGSIAWLSGLTVAQQAVNMFAPSRHGRARQAAGPCGNHLNNNRISVQYKHSLLQHEKKFKNFRLQLEKKQACSSAACR